MITCNQSNVQNGIKESLLHGLFSFVFEISSSRQIIIIPSLNSHGGELFNTKFDDQVTISCFGKSRTIYTDFPKDYTPEDLSMANIVSFYYKSEYYFDLPPNISGHIAIWLIKKDKEL